MLDAVGAERTHGREHDDPAHLCRPRADEASDLHGVADADVPVLRRRRADGHLVRGAGQRARQQRQAGVGAGTRRDDGRRRLAVERDLADEAEVGPVAHVGVGVEELRGPLDVEVAVASADHRGHVPRPPVRAASTPGCSGSSRTSVRRRTPRSRYAVPASTGRLERGRKAARTPSVTTGGPSGRGSGRRSPRVGVHRDQVAAPGRQGRQCHTQNSDRQPDRHHCQHRQPSNRRDALGSISATSPTGPRSSNHPIGTASRTPAAAARTNGVLTTTIRDPRPTPSWCQRTWSSRPRCSSRQTARPAMATVTAAASSPSTTRAPTVGRIALSDSVDVALGLGRDEEVLRGVARHLAEVADVEQLLVHLRASARTPPGPASPRLRHRRATARSSAARRRTRRAGGSRWPRPT